MSNPFEIIQPYNNPEEGREIINYNFSLIGGGITATTSASTFVTGGTNISVVSGLTGPADVVYGVALNSAITVSSIVTNSLSAVSLSAATFFSGSTNLSTLLGAAVSNTTYTNTASTPTTLGGIAAGSTFSAQTVQQMFDALLYPYQTPSFASFSRSSLTTAYEWGQTFPIGAQTFTWSTNNSSNVSANTINITQIFSPSAVLANHAPNVGSTAITLSNTFSASSLVTQALYFISAYNTHNVGFSTTLSATWYPRIYYGTTTTTPLIASNVTSLANNSLAGGFAGTYAFVAGGYKYFCYPSSFGTATTFKDTSTNLSVPMQPLYTVSITNAYGIVITYNVHRSTNILGGSITIQIS